VVSFALEQTSGGSGGSAAIAWITYDADGGEISNGSFVYNQGQTIGELITINPNETFNSIEINFVDVNGTYRLSDLRYGTEVPPLDQALVFEVGVSDADGDSAYKTFTLDLNVDLNAPKTIVGGSSVDVIEGTSSGDTLIGGAGNDTLTGGEGADVFKWSLGDVGTQTSPAIDYITDFSKAEGDKLNLADLLQSENSGNLSQYLNFTTEGGHAVLNVSTTAGGDVVQKVVFENYASFNDLAATFEGAIDSAALIAKMKDAGNLITD
jgi:Ca2+-binding RTX toxin-like protein